MTWTVGEVVQIQSIVGDVGVANIKLYMEELVTNYLTAINKQLANVPFHTPKQITLTNGAFDWENGYVAMGFDIKFNS